LTVVHLLTLYWLLSTYLHYIDCCPPTYIILTVAHLFTLYWLLSTYLHYIDCCPPIYITFAHNGSVKPSDYACNTLNVLIMASKGDRNM